MRFAADFQKEVKRNESRGRCLHFEDGKRCHEIINAHSIQKSNQLSKIVEGGHVCRLIPETSNSGRPTPTQVGWRKVSTFAGFCKHHDNELFKPIDDYPLEPNLEQVALYAYRCMCREYFIKENATNTLNALKNHPELPAESKKFLESSAIGHGLGFHRLKHHKKYFDAALLSRNYHEFAYITLTSSSPWNLQLSGVLYPDYDFYGDKLQDLGDLKSPLDFITFFTAPLSQGWSFTLCWHASSNKSCVSFTNSLLQAVSAGDKPQDALFRFSFSCCENHAFRISWWEGLPTSAKDAILERVNLMVAPGIPIPSNYLAQGLEGIADWEFENVFTSLIRSVRW